MIANFNEQVGVVIVTYDSQRHFLRKIFEQLSAMQVGQIVLVNNGKTELFYNGFDKIHVIKTTKNLGLAGGLHLGVNEAIKLGSNYIWILDDDNLPEKNALAKLLIHMEKLNQENALDKLMLLAYRPFLFRNIFLHQPEKGIFSIGPMKNSFLGFHIVQLLVIIRNRLIGRQSRKQLKTITGSRIRLDTGYYGGLFFHKTVYQSMAPPDQRFFIYWDDLEYTNHFHRIGGSIYLIPECKVEDMDASTAVLKKKHFFHHPFIDLQPQFKAYYYIRNLLFYERRWSESPTPVYLINKMIMSFLIVLFGLIRGKPGRVSLLYAAVRAAKNFQS